MKMEPLWLWQTVRDQKPDLLRTALPHYNGAVLQNLRADVVQPV